MQPFRTFSRRLFLSVLFCGALLTTIQSITGLTMQEIGGWLQQEAQSISESSAHADEEKKTVENVSTSVKTTNHKKSLNLNHYPSKVVLATGYTAGKESTGKTPGEPTYGITYSGVQVTRDLFSTIAADPAVFPIGTILYIPGYGYGVVADTGSAIKGNKIDLYFNTVEDVYKEWGKRRIKVYVLRKGSGTLTQEAMKRLNSQDSLQVFDQKS